MRIRCPICACELEVPEDFAPRPFCSTRCRKIDLGNWLSERYVLSEPLTEMEEPRAFFIWPDELTD